MRENEKATWPFPGLEYLTYSHLISHLNAIISPMKQSHSVGWVKNERHRSLKKFNTLFTLVGLSAVFKSLRQKEETALTEPQCEYWGA